MTVMKYEHRFLVTAPLAAVAGFHRDTRALKTLTPPPLMVQFNHIEPLAEGSLADFTLRLGPLAIRWVAVHSEVSLLNGFVDTQKEGPFDFWRHRHTFRAVNDQSSEVIDSIEAAYGGPISRFMWLNLPVLFAYRALRTKRALEGQGTGLDS
ncbi:MAG: SRPBCC family protein [Candidatus Promineifilaceae bacterium]